MRRFINGFSLIEMLITLAIIAILASVAYPIYTHHVMNARRKHAEVMLLSSAQQMENYRATHGDYRHATLATLKINTHDEPYYKFIIHVISDQRYVLKAFPIKSQSGDACGALEINDLGERKALGSDPANCW